MNAHKIETTLTEDGILILQKLPFQAGDSVEVIILKRTQTQNTESITDKSESNLYSLRGKQPYRYDEPFEPATSLEDWEVLR